MASAEPGPDRAALEVQACRAGRGPALFVTALAFAVAVAWSFTVPVFEAPDEPAHWQYARFLHDQRRLPHYEPGFVEANSPPLYYALIAPFARPGELPPRVRFQRAGGGLELPFPPRRFLNAGDDLERYWPVRVGRLLTCAMAAAAAWFTFVAGRRAAGSPAAGLLGAAFVGLLPQFAFRGGSVSNDTLAATLSAAVTVLLVGQLREGATTWAAVGAGVCLAAAYLTKISTIALVPAVAVASALAAGPPRRRWGYLAVVLGVAGLLVLPWSLRNVFLYGDPFASGAMHEAVPYLIAEKPLTSPYFYRTFPLSLAESFIGNFGWMNVPLPGWVYGAFLTLFAGGMAALVAALVRRRVDRRAVLVLACIAVGCLAVVVRINLTFNQAQGRYLFPALPALAVLWAMGTAHWLGGGRPGRVLAWLIVGLLAVLNAYALVGVVRPAYYPPVVARLSRAVREVHATATRGLEPEASGWWLVRETDAQLAFATDAGADDFSFLQLVIQGVRDAQVRRPRRVGAAVSFAAADAPSGGGTLPFDWIADGQEHRITLPLVKDRSWRGRVSEVRVNPFEAGASSAVGCRIRISDVQLRGSPGP